MNTTISNPYVGPRTFLKTERNLFFGRDREALDLAALVVTQKLVLFYAQSGAGKSSLINTRLIPELEENLYEVLPVARVSGDAPKGIEVDNIYVYNLIHSLIQHKDDSGSLANLTLSQFMGRLNEDENGYFYDKDLATEIRGHNQEIPWRRALIVDQFEEVFSTNLDAWAKREEFFRQLAQAMQDDPYLWVVLVMREDYIAAMDPYAHLVPGGMRVRYYMERLSTERAIEAVEGPAKRRDRNYAEGAAKTLVEALSQVNVRGPDNKEITKPGQYVEPVQLQVVCSSLWKKLEDKEIEISNDRVAEHIKKINQVLGDFYQERVEVVAHGKIAQEKRIKERDIRDWFEEQLIINGKRRNMVAQQNGGKSGGLDDQVVREFLGSIVREEKRGGGATFYELTHDRMVEPIIENNRLWDLENSSPFRRQAEEWKANPGNEIHLLSDAALLEAEHWAEQYPAKLTETDTEFLATGKKRQKQKEGEEEQKRKAQQEKLEAAQKVADEQARSAKRARRFTLIALSLSFIAIVAALYARGQSIRAKSAEVTAVAAQATAQSNFNIASTAKVEAEQAQSTAEASKIEALSQKASAEKSAEKALAGSLAAQADSIKSNDHTLALLLGMEAYLREDSLLTRTTLFQLLQFSPYTRLYGFNGPVSSVAVSPDGKLIATSSCTADYNLQCKNGVIRLFDAETNQLMSEIAKDSGEYGIVYSLAFSPTASNLLVAGGCVPSDGNNRGCADNKGQITFWDVSDPYKVSLLSDTLITRPEINHIALVKTIAFSPDGNTLASGSYDKTIILWNVSDITHPSPWGSPLRGHSSFVNGIAFSPIGKTFVSAGDDRAILIYDYTNPEAPTLIRRVPKDQEHKAPVNSIAFSPDGKWFASASDDNTVILWNWDSKSLTLQRNTPLKGHTGYVKSIAFNKDGTLLASAGFDNKVLLWNISANGIFEQSGLPLDVHSDLINAIAFGVLNNTGKDLPYLLSASGDHTAIKWDLTTRRALSTPVTILTSEPKQTASSGNLKAVIDTQGDNTKIFLSNTKTPEVPQLRHTGQVNSVAFGTLPDSTLLLASASDDQTVVLWKTPEDGSQIEKFLTLEGFNNPVLNAYFSENGQSLITVIDKNGYSVKWIIDPSVWETLVCDAVNSNLSTIQWNNFIDYLPERSPKETCVTQP